MEIWIVKFSILMIFLQLFINTLKIVLNRPINYGTLQCGIYGFSGKLGLVRKDMQIALQKFKILGLYNESRGKDSCGIYINNVLKKGIGTTKLFSGFIEKEVFEVSSKNRVFLGHNRSASVGSKTDVENAHPFLIDDDMLITHNGTIKDTFDFCKKYELEWKDINVDSIMLGQALYRKGEKVLETYKGHAALAYTYRSRPNILYLFHGASRSYKNGVETEERPLYYMETREGIYYSSIDNALDAIRENDDEISLKLAYNTVFEIRDGVFTGADVKIERGDINVEPIKTYNSSAWEGHYGGNYGLPFHQKSITKNIYPKNASSTASYSLTKGTKSPDPIVSLSRESLPKRVYNEKEGTFLYYFHGKHFIRNVGADDVVADGELWIATKGYVLTEGNRKNGILYYFYKGHMAKDKAAYGKLVEAMSQMTPLERANNNFVQILSNHTAFPVFDMDFVNKSDFRWYIDNKIANSPFTPKFSNRTYKLVNGYLEDIKCEDERCYYVDITRATAELEMYKSGLVDGIINQHFAEEHTIKKPEESGFSKELGTRDWWDRVFKTKEEAKKAIGSIETMALDDYSQWFLENDTPWKYNAQDIADKTEQIINESVNNGISIEEIIADTEGMLRVKFRYKELSEAAFESINMESSTLNPIDLAVMEDEVGKVVTLVEQVFNLLEELEKNAKDLEGIGIEEASEMAVQLYQLIAEFKNHCESSDMNNMQEFNKFSERMEKLKTDGTL